MRMSMTDLQEIADRMAIEARLIRYVNANDADDWEGMVECFADDASWGDGPAETREALLERFSTMRTRSSNIMPIDRVRTAQHLITNVEIELDGDVATSTCAATAYLVGPRGENEVLLVRGIVYTDRLVRNERGWLIQNRKHQLKWMYEGDLVAGSAS
jgi:3-phenylpropionate/cinnamic acid dioxygenase small subunit